MERFGLKEDVIAFIVDKARECDLSKVILFGSRAKGDFTQKSDIDLAISGSSLDDFKYAMEEECPTLLDFDFITLDQDINNNLRERIAQEGIVLYEVCKL